MPPIPPSELVLNPDGSIYHLKLHPEQIASTVFLVGDPGRVSKVSEHFDRIEHRVQKREFITHTGWLGNRRLTVLSTGIGTDNIDIVLNELDALVNIDFQTRTIRENLVSLDIVRIGTSGSLARDIPVDSLVVSSFGIGLDNLLDYYRFQNSTIESELSAAFERFLHSLGIPLRPSVIAADAGLESLLGKGIQCGITMTCPGFYAPQGRELRLQSILNENFFKSVEGFRFDRWRLTNFEMETSAILGLSKMLGHRAASCNAILANRITREFSNTPAVAEEKLIRHVLERITGSC